jgi:protein tyrosine phosphatase (PTP) superfamily phosphohydrolase (DUF442 family)
MSNSADTSGMPTPCGFDLYAGSCRFVPDHLYVMGQPTPEGLDQIAGAQMQWVLNIRDPDESQPPQVPDEASGLIVDGVLYVQIPVPHGLSHDQFNEAASVAVLTLFACLNYGATVIHCSTGDRASAIFAVMLIAGGGVTNDQAIQFAKRNLLLADPEFVDDVQHYKTPLWFEYLLQSGAYPKAQKFIANLMTTSTSS